ncbi:hypothetical protein GALL_551130 [mine drainage metagenome]|uniref:Uncharacterized protein n=1 Tax=mine drainage metagenome TaxID=410659 RepID=A0A1J5NX44_9ZZZZ
MGAAVLRGVEKTLQVRLVDDHPGVANGSRELRMRAESHVQQIFVVHGVRRGDGFQQQVHQRAVIRSGSIAGRRIFTRRAGLIDAFRQ